VLHTAVWGPAPLVLRALHSAGRAAPIATAAAAARCQGGRFSTPGCLSKPELSAAGPYRAGHAASIPPHAALHAGGQRQPPAALPCSSGRGPPLARCVYPPGGICGPRGRGGRSTAYLSHCLTPACWCAASSRCPTLSTARQGTCTAGSSGKFTWLDQLLSTCHA
jgi:hypothetical protein